MTEPRKLAFLLLGCAALIAVVGWAVYQDSRERMKVIEAQRREIQALKAEIRLAGRRADGAGKNPSGGSTLASDTVMEGDAIIMEIEDVLDAWIGRMSKLQAYLEKHPEKGIPEMAQLTVSDWLDATKDAALESEAGFRKALAELRADAKRSRNRFISGALREFILANEGRLPANVQELAPYLPQDYDRSILQRFSMDTTGEKMGSGREMIILVEKPVDQLWHTIVRFGDRGSVGTRRLHQEKIEGAIANAVGEFQRVTGDLPISASDLMPYLASDIQDASTVEAVFNALTTVPDLGDDLQ